MLNIHNYKTEQLIAIDDFIENITERKTSSSSFSCSELFALQILIKREMIRRERLKGYYNEDD